MKSGSACTFTVSPTGAGASVCPAPALEPVPPGPGHIFATTGGGPIRRYGVPGLSPPPTPPRDAGNPSSPLPQFARQKTLDELEPVPTPGSRPFASSDILSNSLTQAGFFSTSFFKNCCPCQYPFASSAVGRSGRHRHLNGRSQPQPARICRIIRHGLDPLMYTDNIFNHRVRIHKCKTAFSPF